MEGICFPEISVEFHRINVMTGQKIVLFISTILRAPKLAITAEYSYLVKSDKLARTYERDSWEDQDVGGWIIQSAAS
jgi:hypothetical protein